jgi:hypothetical protein
VENEFFLREQFGKTAHFNRVCTWVGKFFLILRQSERDRNDWTVDFEALLPHGVQKKILYFPLMQGNLVWIAC